MLRVIFPRQNKSHFFTQSPASLEQITRGSKCCLNLGENSLDASQKPGNATPDPAPHKQKHLKSSRSVCQRPHSSLMYEIQNPCVEKELLKNVAAATSPSTLTFSSSCGLMQSWVMVCRRLGIYNREVIQFLPLRCLHWKRGITCHTLVFCQVAGWNDGFQGGESRWRGPSHAQGRWRFWMETVNSS